MTKTEQYIEKLKELVEWLDGECPAVAPPLEPYNNSDLSHYFCDRLRMRLDDIATLEAKLADQKPVNELQKLMDDIAEWSDKQFGEYQRNPSIVYHLEKEVKELIEVFEQGVVTQEEIDKLKMEFADCLMLLLDSAGHAFFSADDLLVATRQKLEINKQCDWGIPDKNGVVEHLKTKQ